MLNPCRKLSKSRLGHRRRRSKSWPILGVDKQRLKEERNVSKQNLDALSTQIKKIYNLVKTKGTTNETTNETINETINETTNEITNETTNETTNEEKLFVKYKRGEIRYRIMMGDTEKKITVNETDKLIRINKVVYGEKIKEIFAKMQNVCRACCADLDTNRIKIQYIEGKSLTIWHSKKFYNRYGLTGNVAEKMASL